MTDWLSESQVALLELIRLPDPPDLPARGKRLVNPGDPIQLRRMTWAHLPIAYVAHYRASRSRVLAAVRG